jgi:predicted aspartyl protease
VTAAALAVIGCKRVAEPALPPGSYQIHMMVVKGRHGETMALVPVYINGQGPFAFALDTGASRTVIDRQIAEELRLPAIGEPVEVTGVGGSATAQPVRVENWRIDKIDVPAATMEAVELANGDKKLGLHGLLGSDTLAKFEVIHIDYKNQRLVFQPGESRQIAATP